MIKIDSILEDDYIIEYLVKRNLFKQYNKKKKQILLGHPELADLKLREPKEAGIYYFRINNQFRAWGKIRKNKFIILKIDNHQN